ncbi:uncharacterized protein M6B38_296065 [Iris pallida]|uniref:Retrotransposon gag domain-containing protein n=1 Tax=Iris pallida TaxID=29817 RepID=A0AAX6HRC3_IRIPA|nr:uncharacterized protein M6B38_296065 [Iris pallida]
MDLRPREFKGTEGILYTDDWLENVDRNLRMARIPEDKKVETASMQLYDIACTRYRDEPRFTAPNVTWEEFKELFKTNFYPDAAREELENEFESLEQGNLSIDEYTVEFFRLSRFADALTPEAKAKKFRKGLSHKIRIAIANSQATTYERILKVVQAVEKEIKRKQKRDRDAYGGGNNQSGSTKRSNTPGKTAAQQHQPQPRFQPQQYQPPARAPTFQQNLQRQPVNPCTYCKKPGHAWEVCRKLFGVCLFYGSSAHQLRKCILVPPYLAQGRAPAPGAPMRPAIPQ